MDGHVHVAFGLPDHLPQGPRGVKCGAVPPHSHLALEEGSDAEAPNIQARLLNVWSDAVSFYRPPAP